MEENRLSMRCSNTVNLVLGGHYIGLYRKRGSRHFTQVYHITDKLE